MNVKMRFDCLLFSCLSTEQFDDLVAHSGACEVFVQDHETKVKGKPADLYNLLFKLTSNYDLELS